MQNNDRLVQLTDANGNDIYPVTINPDDIARIEMTQTDPGEGSPLAANHFVAVYGASSQVQTADIANNAVTADKIDFTTLKRWLPDYSNQVSLGGISSYTATGVGWIVSHYYGWNTTQPYKAEIKVNGKTVYTDTTEAPAPNGARASQGPIMFPISTGDQVTGLSSETPSYFIPGKWV